MTAQFLFLGGIGFQELLLMLLFVGISGLVFWTVVKMIARVIAREVVREINRSSLKEPLDDKK